MRHNISQYKINISTAIQFQYKKDKAIIGPCDIL